MPLATLIPLIVELITEAPTMFRDIQSTIALVNAAHTSGAAPQPQEKIDAMNLAVAASLSSQAAAQAAAGPKPV